MWIYLIASSTAIILVVWTIYLFEASKDEAKVDVQEAKDKLEVAYEELKQNKMLSERLSAQVAYANLTRRIAHEIKNPMSMLLSRAELVQGQLDNKESVKKFSDMMIRNILRLQKLLGAMLEYGTNVSDSKEAFSVNDMLDELVDLIGPKCGTDYIQLHINMSDRVFAYGSKIHIYQALLNIAVNALQFSKKKGDIFVSLDDDISYMNKDEESCLGCKVTIRDTGEGISEEHLSKVFDPYFTTKAQTENAGLGLSITFRTIIENDGLITIDSVKGEGTNVQVYLKKPIEM